MRYVSSITNRVDRIATNVETEVSKLRANKCRKEVATHRGEYEYARREAHAVAKNLL